MDLEDAGCRAQFLIRNRDGKFPALFDAILADAGIQLVLSVVRMPRMNSIMERWVQTCRRELLDRTLVWNPVPPSARPAGVRGVLQRAPTAPAHRQRPPPPATAIPLAAPDQIASLHVRRRDRLGGYFMSTGMRHGCMDEVCGKGSLPVHMRG